MSHFLGLRQWWHCRRNHGHRPLKMGDGWVIRACMDCRWFATASPALDVLVTEYRAEPWPIVRVAEGSERP